MTEGGADTEKRLILQELQKKLTEANSSLKQVRQDRRPYGVGRRQAYRGGYKNETLVQAVQQKRILQQVTTRCNLTVEELNGLPDSIPCFESVGRACAAISAQPSPVV